MNIKLLAYTQLTDEFKKYLENITDGQAVALTAIRTCYSPNMPSEILEKEGERYLKRKATDGKGGTEADRLIRHIVNSKHTSTLEHVTFTFAIEGLSRAALAQLTRHRVGFSYSVQSQRYVRFGSDDKTEGFDFILPKSVADRGRKDILFENTLSKYLRVMDTIQETYDFLRENGIPAEDARMVYSTRVWAPGSNPNDTREDS
mgnify:CR=1 FL=1